MLRKPTIMNMYYALASTRDGSIIALSTIKEDMDRMVQGNWKHLDPSEFKVVEICSEDIEVGSTSIFIPMERFEETE